jgi:hypothetical protein
VFASTSIFFDINLPNAATWFYFSGLLAFALFLKFSRLLSIRNWDVLTLLLFTPGFLLLLEAKGREPWGYVWLLAVSGYFVFRCLLDLTLVRRPALAPNLNLSGLACLAGALFVSLTAVACRQPGDPSDSPGEPAPSPADGLLTAALPRVEDAAKIGIPQLTAARALSLACHLSIVVGLVLVGWRCFEDVQAGMAAATFYLLLPFIYYLTPYSDLGLGRWDDLWPMAWMVWAVFCYRRPVLAGTFLGIAAGGALFPVLTLPVWLGFYGRRGGGRFLAVFLLAAGLCLALCVGAVWATGAWPSPAAVNRWFPWREPPADARGVWQGVFWVYRLPVFIGYAAFVLTTLFWPSPKTLAHVLALSAAVLLGAQFWCADHGGIYILWYAPFLLLMVFRPNLSAARAPLLRDDWMTRLGRRLRLAVRRVFQRRQEVRVG